MKLNRKPLETPVMDHHLSMRYSSRLFLLIILFLLSLSYLFYSINLPKSAFICNIRIETPKKLSVTATTPVITSTPTKTNLHHLVFGIAASSNLWNRRKNYIKLWWRPHEMRGFVWLDTSLRNNANDDHLLPMVKISSSTSHFRYNYPKGYRSAIRISRIVSETLRLGLTDVRWFVMGDDDTFFVPDNLVRVLSKYDHNQFFYIGSNSESHTQNVRFSYGMAYGGGGFAISYPLAVALEKMQDRCIQRYPELYGSDDRIQACMAELGVPLTKESGFHQYDVYGNLFGLLASHPVTPLVSIHHLDVVNPIFPKTSRVEALKRLTIPIKLDSAAIMQQSICYDNHRNWTVSVTWGYAVQIWRGVLSPREGEKIARTFISWYRTGDAFAYAFNTRSYSENICKKPHVYHFSNATYHDKIDETISDYVWNQVPNPFCNWNIANPSEIVRVEVYKRPDPHLWDKSPRRNCCRVLPAERLGTMKVDVGVCRENEVIEQMLGKKNLHQNIAIYVKKVRNEISF